jgi:hypothetical protein
MMVSTHKATVVLLAMAFGGGVLVGRGSPLAAQAKNRIFEIRTYTANEGKLDALVKRMRDKEAKIFEKNGMKGIGFFVAAEAPKSENTYVYILAHESREAARASWAKFGNDPEWKELRQSSEAAGPILVQGGVQSIFVNPLDFSPLK